MEDELLAWAPQPGDQPTAPVSLPGYSDFRLVTHGGEGAIYRARQDGLGRDVAVKVLSCGDDPATLARFRRELAITVELGRQHPHIVTVLDTGTLPDGRPCIVMEYYERGSLHDLLRATGPLPVADVVAAGTAVADALAFAHAQGILHRDVKPQNVLLLPTSYVLADFGIARGFDAEHSASLEMVSYRHAAPQMLDGDRPAASDDLWSLGSTLFTLLEGKPPFASDNPDEDTLLSYVGRVRSSSPRPLTRPGVPPGLASVIARCLQKDRGDRFADAAALRAALSAPLASPLSTVDPDSTFLFRERVEVLPEGPTSAPGFGPVPIPEEPTAVVEAVEDERDDSWLARLDDLTRRQNSVVVETIGPGTTPPPASAPTPDFNSASAPSPASRLSPTSGISSVDIEPQTDRAPARRKRRGPVLAVLALTTVTVGIVLGVTFNRPNQPPVTQPTTTTTTTLAVPETTASVPQGSDPRFAPVLKRAEFDGSVIELEWTDPSGGKAQFVVVDVSGKKPDPLLTVAAGGTKHTIEQAGDRQRCFQILAIGLDDPTTQRGSSAKVCAVKN